MKLIRRVINASSRHRDVSTGNSNFRKRAIDRIFREPQSEMREYRGNY